MQSRVYWVSVNEPFQNILRNDPQFSQISRCFSAKEALKVLALWLLGLL